MSPAVQAAAAYLAVLVAGPPKPTAVRLLATLHGLPWPLLGAATVAALALWVVVARAIERWHAPHRLEQELAERLELLKAFIEENFLLEPCQRCLESRWSVLEASPSGRSVHALCTTCGKDRWMGSASAPEPELVPELAELEGLRAQHAALYPDRPPPTKLVVEAPAAPLPTDAATREPIPEAVRAHVWRRDEGRCCRCDSATQLEFDHIIPLALGGSSTANNLQLLCRGCNRSKGARIA